jgi:hypothetical protein
MYGIMPGPLWLAIVSSVKGTSSLTRSPIHHPKSDTFAEKKIWVPSPTILPISRSVGRDRKGGCQDRQT